MAKFVDATETTSEPFDFDMHAFMAGLSYGEVRPKYERFALTIQKLAEVSLEADGTNFHRIEARAKSDDSFETKARKVSEWDPNEPKYADPVREILDLAGVRIITFFPRSLEAIDEMIFREFKVLEKSDKAEELEEEGKFGYSSIHYLVKLKPNRLGLPEYSDFDGMVAEIQARTILQHAWAEIEHDIQYKSVEVMPRAVRRRFISLAGVLEIADREFQAIQDMDEEIRQQARQDLHEGRFEDVEITPDAVRSYLDARFGPDGRISDFSYEYLARQLSQMGFSNFKEIDDCILGYDSDAISTAIWQTRQGQISRFEDTMVAGMGINYMTGHPYEDEDWFELGIQRRLRIFVDNGIKIGDYSPFTHGESANDLDQEGAIGDDNLPE